MTLETAIKMLQQETDYLARCPSGDMICRGGVSDDSLRRVLEFLKSIQAQPK